MSVVKANDLPKDDCFLNLKLVALCDFAGVVKSKYLRHMITLWAYIIIKWRQGNERRSPEDRSEGWDGVAEN